MAFSSYFVPSLCDKVFPELIAFTETFRSVYLPGFTLPFHGFMGEFV